MRIRCLRMSVLLGLLVIACQNHPAGVGPVAAPVAAVSVVPQTASLSVSTTVPLTATVWDSIGNALSGRSLTWVTSDPGVATVSGTGMVQGVSPGTAAITAASEGKSDTAIITVVTAVGTILLQEGFEDAAFGARGWYDNTSMATTTAEHYSGTRALEVHFTQGAKIPTWGGASRHLFQETEAVYIRYWVKYSANWVGSGQNFHPHEFYFLTNEDGQYTGPSFTHLTAYVEHIYQNGGLPVLGLQDAANIDQTKIGQDLTSATENRAASGCNGNSDGHSTGCYDQGGGVFNNEKRWKTAQPYFAPTPGPGYKNEWHLVEAFFQLNSIQNGEGLNDGIVRYWFDGQLVIEHTNVLMRTGIHATMKFNQLLIGPWIGSGSPGDQYMWVDDLLVATARP